MSERGQRASPLILLLAATFCFTVKELIQSSSSTSSHVLMKGLRKCAPTSTAVRAHKLMIINYYNKQ